MSERRMKDLAIVEIFFAIFFETENEPVGASILYACVLENTVKTFGM